ncbi:unnamed protein product [Caenorhabditis brenneri]
MNVDDKTKKLSEFEIEDVLKTKFICANESDESENAEENVLEKPRSVSSPLQFSPIETPNDDVVLEDYEFLSRPVEGNMDNAIILLNRIQNSSEDVLRDSELWNVYERSRKWKNTSRSSELELVNFILSSVDIRPSILHIYCRHLNSLDLGDVIRKSILEVAPPTKYRSLFRLTIETQISLDQFISNLEKIWENDWKVNNQMVTSSNPELYDTQFFSKDILQYMNLEHKLPYAFLSSTARFSIFLPEKPFLIVNVGYHDELDEFEKRKKTIVIEQIVRPVSINTRYVSFGIEEVEKVWEFEVDEDLPFYRMPPIGSDLIDYLKAVDDI